MDHIRRTAMWIAITFFIVWELARHLLLMSASMLVQHVVSAIVEAGLTGAVVFIFCRLMDERERHREADERFARVLATAIGGNVTIKESIRRIRDSVDVIRNSFGDDSPGRQAAESILRETETVESILKSLDALGEQPAQDDML